MNRLNWLFTAASLSVLLVTAERFSFTTPVITYTTVVYAVAALASVVVRMAVTRAG